MTPEQARLGAEINRNINYLNLQIKSLEESIDFMQRCEIRKKPRSGSKLRWDMQLVFYSGISEMTSDNMPASNEMDMRAYPHESHKGIARDGISSNSINPHIENDTDTAEAFRIAYIAVCHQMLTARKAELTEQESELARI